MGETLLRVTLGVLCFGLVEDTWHRIIAAPSVADWAIGKDGWAVARYYFNRGAIVECVYVQVRKEEESPPVPDQV